MSSVPVDKRNHVLAFVALHHAEQKRKYTNEPYLSHLQAVANMADGKCAFGYEIGLCHDLLEDTDCDKHDLLKALKRFGYTEHEALVICVAVIELTDVYISGIYEILNRKLRKGLEAKRLHNVSYEAQTVKYCDLIHNTESIVQYDKGFAKVYLSEKEAILAGMTKGNPEMLAKCKRVLKSALKALS